MTVGELALELAKLRQDILVEVWHPDDGWMPALISEVGDTLRMDQDWDLYIKDLYIKLPRKPHKGD